MKAPLRFFALGMLALVSCLQKFELPPEPLGMGGGGGSANESTPQRPDPDAGAAPAACGEQNQACCAKPLAACEPGLRCDEGRLGCVPEEQRLCTGDQQCHPGQTCCKSGLLASCVTLAPGGACPLPDLVIPEQKLTFSREDHVFDPNSPADYCALAKGCVGGPGLRHLLRFSVQVKNQGDADLLLGVPGMTPGFTDTTCGGEPTLPNYLSYELVDILNGTTRARANVPARCQELPAGFNSRFSCEFWGLWSGFSETFAPTYTPSGYAPSDPSWVDCQWVDITDVPAGDYELRVRANPEGLLEERRDNNQATFRVPIPELDDPAAVCPVSLPDDPVWSLIGSDVGRECGWSPTFAASCTPGALVGLGCDSCAGSTMLRVCESASCSATSAIGAVSTYDVTCPLLRFVCPASGSYSALGAASISNTPFSCIASERPVPSFDPLATCPGIDDPLLGFGLQRDCGWESASTSPDAGVTSTGSCEPGAAVEIGCSTCTPYPPTMLRVCDGSTPCRSYDTTVLASADNSAGQVRCPGLSFSCPASGNYTVLRASYYSNQPFSCDLP